jgi:hypothetical protein
MSLLVDSENGAASMLAYGPARARTWDRRGPAVPFLSV